METKDAAIGPPEGGATLTFSLDKRLKLIQLIGSAPRSLLISSMVEQCLGRASRHMPARSRDRILRSFLDEIRPVAEGLIPKPAPTDLPVLSGDTSPSSPPPLPSPPQPKGSAAATAAAKREASSPLSFSRFVKGAFDAVGMQDYGVKAISMTGNALSAIGVRNDLKEQAEVLSDEAFYDHWIARLDAEIRSQLLRQVSTDLRTAGAWFDEVVVGEVLSGRRRSSDISVEDDVDNDVDDDLDRAGEERKDGLRRASFGRLHTVNLALEMPFTKQFFDILLETATRMIEAEVKGSRRVRDTFLTLTKNFSEEEKAGVIAQASFMGLLVDYLVDSKMEDPAGAATLEDLPTATLGRVLGFLPVEQVLVMRGLSRRFAAIGNSEAFWKWVRSLRMVARWIPVSPVDVAPLFQRLINLRSVENIPPFLCDVVLREIADHCRSVEHIDLSRARRAVMPPILCEVIQSCSGLRSLILEGCWQVGDTVITKLGLLGPNKLLRLNLRECAELSAIGVEELAPALGALEWLDLGIADGQLDYLTERSLQTIAKSSPRLHHLGLAYRRRVTQEALTHVFSVCRELVSLDIEGFSDGGDVASAEYFAAASGSLSRINLANADRLSESFVTSLGQALPGLHELTFPGCERISAAGVVGLIGQCRSLVAFDYSGCVYAEDECVLTALTFCEHLRVLRCYSVSDAVFEALGEDIKYGGLAEFAAANCGSLSSGGFSSLVGRFFALETLDLSQCGKNLEDFSAVRSLQRTLVSLRIRSAVMIDEFSVQCIAQFLPNLRLLDLSECLAGIGDDSLMLITASQFRLRLQSLFLAGLPSVTDNLIGLLCLTLPRLTELDVSTCHNVTAEGVASLKAARRLRILRLRELPWSTALPQEPMDEFWEQLEVLDLTGCPGITPRDIDALKLGHSGLQVLS